MSELDKTAGGGAKKDWEEQGPRPGCDQFPISETFDACSWALLLTFLPKILKPARAIRAMTPTRMMYSTRFAPRESAMS